MPPVGGGAEPQPEKTPQPEAPRLFDLELRRVPGVEGSFSPRSEPIPAGAPVGPVFGAFRPILGRPAGREGEAALVAVISVCNRDSTQIDGPMVEEIARSLAEGTFPDNGEGFALTEKLVRALVTRDLDSFGADDRERFAALSGEREFPRDPRGADLYRRWIVCSTTERDNSELNIKLTIKGIGLHEVVPGRLWVRGEPRSEFFDSFGGISERFSAPPIRE